MSAIIKSETISRRKALSLMGLAAAFGLAAAPTVLAVSDAEAQTAAAPTAAAPTTGTERRQERRTARTERRQQRRTARTERRQVRRTGTTTVPEQAQLPAQPSNSTARHEPAARTEDAAQLSALAITQLGIR